MTPEEARALLDGTTPGDEWHYRARWGRVWRVSPIGLDRTFGTLEVSKEDAALIVAAPSLAAMVAGMREEWAGQYLEREGKWATICAYPTREEVAHHLDHGCWDAYTHTRIVRRYVTEPEEA